MREKDLQAATLKMLFWLKARKEILEFYHTLRSKGSQAGYPDWTIVLRKKVVGGRGPEGKLAIPIAPTRMEPDVIWVELKTAKGKLTRMQMEWRKALGSRYYVARSLDDFSRILCGCGVDAGLTGGPG